MRNSRAARPEAGFTLIETVVVLVVVGLLMGILIGRGPTRSATIDLTAASRSLTDALRSTRARAITTALPVSFGLAEARATVLRHASRTPAGPMRIGLHSPADNPRGDGSVRFDPDGGANDARIVLDEGQEQVSIGIDWLTGRISQGPLQRVDGGA